MAPSTSLDAVERVRTAFERSPRRSIRRTNKKLEVPTTTAWRVIKRPLHMTPYKLPLVQQLKDTDKPTRCNFCIAMQEKLGNQEFDNGLFLAIRRPFS